MYVLRFLCGDLERFLEFGGIIKNIKFCYFLKQFKQTTRINLKKQMEMETKI